VLVVDLDPQGNATTGLGVNPRNLEASVYDVIMHDAPLEDCIVPTSLRNLFVVPATIDLAGAEIELVPAFSRELKLRRGLERLGDDFAFTLIDCPPSLGLLTVNGLAPAPSWPSRLRVRCGPTSATRCAATSCPARCVCRRPPRSGNRSSCSIPRPGGPSPTGNWPRR
jgi:hypothetical protein